MTKTVWAAVALVVTLLLVQNGYLLTKQENEGQWECAQTACSTLMTPEEIVSKICFLDDAQKFMCNLNVNGQQALVPLDSLNLSALNLCSEFTCVKEVMVRDAEYPVQGGLV